MLKLPLNLVAGALLAALCGPAWSGAYEDMIRAIGMDDQRSVASLLKRGVDVDSVVAPDGDTLLILAAKEGKAGLVKLLLGARPKVNARNRHGETALMFASFHGHADVVKQLLGQGAEVNQSGWTPLMYSTVHNRTDIARVLLGKGAQVNAQTDTGITALMMAAREGQRVQLEIV